MAIPLPAALQNSHPNGGQGLLIFVADPRTVWLFMIQLPRHGQMGRSGQTDRDAGSRGGEPSCHAPSADGGE